MCSDGYGTWVCLFFCLSVFLSVYLFFCYSTSHLWNVCSSQKQYSLLTGNEGQKQKKTEVQTLGAPICGNIQCMRTHTCAIRAHAQSLFARDVMLASCFFTVTH